MLLQKMRQSKMLGIESLLGRGAKIIVETTSDGAPSIKEIYLPEGQKPLIPGMTQIPSSQKEILRKTYNKWEANKDTIQGKESLARLQDLAFHPLTSLVLLSAGVAGSTIHKAQLPDFTMVVNCPKDWDGFPEDKTFYIDVPSPEVINELAPGEYQELWKIGAPKEALPLDQIIASHESWFPALEFNLMLATPNMWGVIAVDDTGEEKTATLQCGYQSSYIDDSFWTLLKEWLTHNQDWLIISDEGDTFEAVI